MAEIPSTPADGNVRVTLVPTLADPSAPTVTELTGASAVDISCYLTGDGWAASSDQADAPDERLCTTQDYKKPGRESNDLSLTVIDNTNSPNETDSNEAVKTLVKGASMYAVYRPGIPYETAFEADQVVDVWQFTAGVLTRVAPEANSVLRSTQKEFVGPVYRGVKVVAGA